jgi:hypothetical protein
MEGQGCGWGAKQNHYDPECKRGNMREIDETKGRDMVE